MTVSDICGRVYDHIDDNAAAPVSVYVASSDPTVNGVVIATEVLNAINEGQQLAALLTLCFEKTANFTLGTSGSIDAYGAFYQPRPILTDLVAPLRLAVGGVRLRPSGIEELDSWNSNWQNTPGPAKRYCLLGSNLWAVTPQSNQTLQVTYACSPPALTATGTPILSEEFHQDLVDYSVYRVKLKEGAQQLQRGLIGLNSYLDSMTVLGNRIRARSLAAHYVTQPFELAKFDRSQLGNGAEEGEK